MRERERESCCACLLDGKSRPGRKSEPEETPDSCFPYQRGSSGWRSGMKHPRTRLLTPAEKRLACWSKPHASAPLFSRHGLSARDYDIVPFRARGPEVQSSRQRSLGHRDAVSYLSYSATAPLPTAPLKGLPSTNRSALRGGDWERMKFWLLKLEKRLSCLLPAHPPHPQT